MESSQKHLDIAIVALKKIKNLSRSESGIWLIADLALREINSIKPNSGSEQN
ncbi:hypothetical protein [Leptolyngbya sp. 'hensonii']|uniref:hypothetical protein n=1 Tax=Leptolyngbya sp. 'hensonii' TaxID=1922337 RepID=UPI000A4E509B|nr:hypothetical protein [Leptolyngbya sp. 'hensonii']